MSLPRMLLTGGINLFAGARRENSDGAPDVDLPEQGIYYANHSSHLDFLTIWASFPPDLQRRVRPIAAKDYWGAGLRKKVVERVFNAYLVERHGATTERTRESSGGVSPTGQVAGMTAILDAGDSLIIFPEGTRGDGETIGEFHGGLYRLAEHNPQIPVVPVTLINLGRILPKGEKIPVPHLSTLAFGAPLYLGGAEGRADFLERARAALVDTLAAHAAKADDEGDETPPEAVEESS